MDVVKGPDRSSEEQIRQWIIAYEKDLLRLCCVYLRDVTLAEDAVQETFLKAYKHLSAFRGDSHPRTWLIRIAINVCKDMSRSAWFRLLRNAVTLDALQIAQDDEPRQMHSLLVAEIMRLPRIYKEVILLYYYEGFTQAEIADTLNLSVATVHRRIGKACLLLKNVLKGGNDFET